MPDVFAIKASQAYFLELKKSKGARVSPAQREMMARLSAAGAWCAVANGVDEAVAQLERWGLLISTTATAEEMAA